MNCKVIVLKKVMKDKKVYHNYYLVTENGKRIAIKPSFNTDYAKLQILAEEVKDEEKK